MFLDKTLKIYPHSRIGPSCLLANQNAGFAASYLLVEPAIFYDRVLPKNMTYSTVVTPARECSMFSCTNLLLPFLLSLNSLPVSFVLINSQLRQLSFPASTGFLLKTLKWRQCG